MEYQVFVQNPGDRQFVASVLGMPTVYVEGTTEEEAIAKAKAVLESQLATGKFVPIQVDLPNFTDRSRFHLQYAGIFEDDPTFDDWMEKLANIRKEANTIEDP
ncbi:type II toxin-antitoxin system HicB family antitoxin [Pseudanabaena sp. PCC 6802]|uniref:type II toxin-antitoxin system HicB family antitoxin n=1 Tax=Pseudanabaena sp. PCC 6802 TaxID=118173 RepID=UPI0003471507|nr:hypothetical protein [Pseudanabaena sp. PCC 6802]